MIFYTRYTKHTQLFTNQQVKLMMSEHVKSSTRVLCNLIHGKSDYITYLYTSVDYCVRVSPVYRVLSLAVATSACRNPCYLRTYVFTTQLFTTLLYLANLYQRCPFECFIASAYHLHTYYIWLHHCQHH